MAYFTDTRFQGVTIADRFSAIAATWRENAQRNRLYYRTMSELSAMSNRELSDIGISRGQIREIAIEASYMAK